MTDTNATQCRAEETTDLFRPRDGDELMKGLADGKTAEVPAGYGMKCLSYLESKVGDWAILFDNSPNRGYVILRPDSSTSEKFRRFLAKNDTADERR